MKRTALVLAAWSLLAAGCAARMKLDSTLAGAEALDVSGANPRVWGAPPRFGPWKTAAVADATTFGWSFEILGVGGLAGSRRPYGLRLEGPGGTLEMECLQRSFEVLAPFGVIVDAQGARGRPVLACAIRPAGARDPGAAWALVLHATGRPVPAFEGDLRSSRGPAFALRSIHALEGTAIPLGPPAGFSFERGTRPVGAVETVNAGRVVILRSEPEQGPLAAAAAALLLFEPEAG